MGLEDRLARLEGRVEEFSNRLDEGLSSVNRRIDDLRNDMNHRFAETSKRIDDMRSDVNFRFNILLALDVCILAAILSVLFKLVFL